MALEYGLLLMVYSLFLLIAELVPEAQTAMMIVFLTVLIFRFVSVKGELEAHYNE
jgi:ABC-type multidrug transport system permease subunit